MNRSVAWAGCLSKLWTRRGLRYHGQHRRISSERTYMCALCGPVLWPTALNVSNLNHGQIIGRGPSHSKRYTPWRCHCERHQASRFHQSEAHPTRTFYHSSNNPWTATIVYRPPNMRLGSTAQLSDGLELFRITRSLLLMPGAFCIHDAGLTSNSALDLGSFGEP